MNFTTLISTRELFDALGSPDLVIADCRFSLDDPERGRRAYLEEHIPGAIYVHLNKDLSGDIIPGKTGRHPLPPVDEFAKNASALGIGDKIQVVAYDDGNGAYGARLWWLLKYAGHESVAVLEGGFARWKQEGKPVESGLITPIKHEFVPRVRTDMLADAELVQRTLKDNSWVLLDARELARFRGDMEPIDPVAGHIPGAKPAPFTANLDEKGSFNSQNDLRTRFKNLVGDTPPDHVVCYCGSGVTAAHNVLAFSHAGIGMPRLYVGSWSDWITDPSRPVAKGMETQSEKSRPE